MVKEMKIVAVQHGVVITVVAKHKHVMKCLKATKHKFFKMQIKEEI
jgi:hypothetical protein